MYINNLAVLNTVTALGADLNISTDGFTYIKGVESAIPTASISSVNIISPVSAVAGVVTVTPTAANSTLYKITVNGYNVNSGIEQTVVLSYTTASSGDVAETICNAFRAQLAKVSGFSVAGTGTTTLVLTASTAVAGGTTPYVTFAVGGSSGSVSSADASGSSVTIYPNVAAVRTTASVVGIGSTAILQSKYPATSNTSINYTEISSLVASSTYVEVNIQYVTPDSGIASSNSQNLSEVAVLVKSDATNVGDLFGTYGAFTGLQLGYKVVITAPATTTAAVTVTTGAIALAGGAATFATLGGKSGDWIVIGSDITRITGITGLTAGFGTLTTAASAATFKYASWVNLPI